jgi:hypothetical protein
LAFRPGRRSVEAAALDRQLADVGSEEFQDADAVAEFPPDSVVPLAVPNTVSPPEAVKFDPEPIK